jgi:hypothetical protein
MGASSGSGGFAKIRSTLLRQQPVQLIRVIGELYRLSKENQRFLEARFADASKQLHAYRRLVADCLFPDPLRKGAKVRIVEAKRAISQYERATGDTAGTVDLMLTFVERGTSFAGDLGYGEDAFFISLENCCRARWIFSAAVATTSNKACGPDWFDCQVRPATSAGAMVIS